MDLVFCSCLLPTAWWQPFLWTDTCALISWRTWFSQQSHHIVITRKCSWLRQQHRISKLPISLRLSSTSNESCLYTCLVMTLWLFSHYVYGFLNMPIVITYSTLVPQSTSPLFTGHTRCHSMCLARVLLGLVQTLRLRSWFTVFRVCYCYSSVSFTHFSLVAHQRSSLDQFSVRDMR